jgi:monofunctional biosynthetic peptidoglycan transglycosylase
MVLILLQFKSVRRQSKKKKIRGGSTISQQTAKNLFLWNGGGYFRKGLEAVFYFYNRKSLE